MIPEKMFHQILMLGDAWEVERVEYREAAKQVRIQIRETPSLWAKESCPCCNATEVGGYDHAPEREWRHLPVCQLETVIGCALPRGQCRKCQGVYTVKAAWEGRSKHFTQEFEGFALTLMREMPVSKAGEILMVSDQRLWRMLFAHVDAARAELSLEDVVWIGADEMNRRKGHNYVTVFADLVARRVVYATEGKDAETFERFAAELLEHNGHPKAITQVAIDMSAAYAKGVRENLGNAQVVYDKFHVVQHAVEACDRVRAAETRLGPEEQDKLSKTRWLFRKNPENWTTKESDRWKSLARERCATGLAYEMRLVLQDIYRCSTMGRARQKFRDWCSWVHELAAEVGELLTPMRKVAEMVESHQEGILAHWKQGLTTAFMEGLNSLFSAVKRKARGYRSSEYLIAMLYFVAGKLLIPSY